MARAAESRIQPAPAQQVSGGQLHGVSCSSSAACTAVGEYTNSSGALVSLVEGWDGISWTVQSTPNPAGATGSTLSKLSCPSSTACTAVGHYRISPGGNVMLAERWNGTSWAVQSAPSPGDARGSSLFGVSCTSSTACTAVGNYFNSAGFSVTLADAWNGTSWTVQSTPNPSARLTDAVRFGT
jgi:hypothetical protein